MSFISEDNVKAKLTMLMLIQVMMVTKRITHECDGTCDDDVNYYDDHGEDHDATNTLTMVLAVLVWWWRKLP